MVPKNISKEKIVVASERLIATTIEKQQKEDQTIEEFVL